MLCLVLQSSFCVAGYKRKSKTGVLQTAHPCFCLTVLSTPAQCGRYRQPNSLSPDTRRNSLRITNHREVYDVGLTKPPASCSFTASSVNFSGGQKTFSLYGFGFQKKNTGLLTDSGYQTKQRLDPIFLVWKFI